MKRWQLWTLLIAGGAVEALAFPLAIPFLSLRELDPAGHLEWIAWFGLVPCLFALDRVQGLKRAFGAGFVAGTAFYYVAIWWVNHAMTAFGGMPMWQAVPALSLLVYWMALHWGGAFAVSWYLKRKLGWAWWKHLPLVWAAFELLRNYNCSGFPWANLGYIQARHLAVSQLASLLGIYAIAALVVFVNCVLHEALVSRRAEKKWPVKLLGATAGTLALVLAYGLWHLRAVRADIAAAPAFKVGLVQGNLNQSVKNEGEGSADTTFARFLPLTEQADRAGADLVAWPEATYPYFVPLAVQSFAGAKSGLAPLAHAHLMLGASTLDWERTPGGKRVPSVTNSVFLVRPDLAVADRYTKHHLVPFGEYVPFGLDRFVNELVPGFAASHPGTRLELFGVNGVEVAPMICFDAIFPEINVAFAREGAQVLFNPTNDAWYGYSSGPYQFLAIVRLRAIETERAVARPAYSGVTAIVMPTGEVKPGWIDVGPVDPDLAPDPNEPAKVLVGEVPVLRARTLYSRVGDVFAYACSAFALVALVLARRKKS